MDTKEFRQRLALACDNVPHIVPPYGQGRQVYIAERMGVTQEAVRKWFKGEARPSIDKIPELAKLLIVDEAWLALGVEPESDRHAKRMHRDRTEGAVYILLGLITMGGGRCAFPKEQDPRAAYVDFYAIARGQQAAVHVSLAHEAPRGFLEFVVPHEFHDALCVGMIPLKGFRFHLIELPAQLIEQFKQPKGSDYCVRVKHDGGYHTGRAKWPEIHDLRDLV